MKGIFFSLTLVWWSCVKDLIVSIHKKYLNYHRNWNRLCIRRQQKTQIDTFCLNIYLKVIIFLLKVRGNIGGLLDDKYPMLCGGAYPDTNSCYKFQSGIWTQTFSMVEQRTHFVGMSFSPYLQRYQGLKYAERLNLLKSIL